ncbi:hypothetical protein TCAL_13348 [Tigriopus californicus]|uniref:RCC1-like domain-containing protein n=1 Tax=Tigriopus californicus TaxID=6832 RepID=A0A553PD27_TIGCA|nr:uncharacterized protein LOC131892886 [Tigriopus californicus]TRY75583.1 hypothetical protein TCAL_13348 [Tigriopus californicus]|eukprot:TCALIF_13348-PA protein Name:"Similar to glo-4 X-linked retinitis pigmentosa GTPase regulator homolog (Caenorhabditis elegans)" AED:0.15 eAED:0.15 QI:251/1/0.66/1/1/0.66/3/0/1623
MLQHQRVFALSAVAQCPARAGRTELGGVAATPDGSHALLVGAAGSEPALWSLERTTAPIQWILQGVTWFDNEDLRPQCVALSPGLDFAVVAARLGRILVCPTRALWLEPPSNLVKDANYREWNKGSLTRVTQSAAVEAQCAQPRCILWWTTQDFQSVAILGTAQGHLISLDLVTGQVIRETKVCSLPLVQLEVMTDSALDCSYLFVTSSGGTQWRLKLEQRSTGYIWCCSSTTEAEAEPKPSSVLEYRSRLSGLKQMSAAGLASLRQRLNEGRKLLDRRVSNPSSSGSGGGIEVAEEATELGGILNISHGRLESLAAKIGDTRVSVQVSPKNGPDPILAGVFPDTAILTFHNCELEVLPQTAFKLPRGTERLLIQNGIILVSTTYSSNLTNGHNAASPNQRGHLHIVSSHYAELHLDNNSNAKPDAVLQSFSLEYGEMVLDMVPLLLPTKSSESGSTESGEESSQSGQSPNSGGDSLSSPETLGSSSNSKSQAADQFGKRVRLRVAEVTARGQSLFESCLIVTNRGVYVLTLDVDPITTFMDLAIRGGEDRKAEFLARTFGLDDKELYELVADLRLTEGDFSQAFALYQQAECKYLKVALKFSAAGHLKMLGLHYVLQSKPKLTPAELIHLSNLALMSCFQQVLTKSTFESRAEFHSRIRDFVDENKGFDECLAVRMATETREWELLNHISRSRSVHFEMIESIVCTLLGRGTALESRDEIEAATAKVSRALETMPLVELNGLLTCLLAPTNIESVMSNHDLSWRLLLVLWSASSFLAQEVIQNLYKQCCPANSGLRPLYLALLGAQEDSSMGDNHAKTRRDVACRLVTLFTNATLAILKGQGWNQNCDSVPKRYLDDVSVKTQLNDPDQDWDEQVRTSHCTRHRQIIAGGSKHVLLQRKGSVMTWGMTAFGVLGHGASASRFSTPKEVVFFSASQISVFSVACGRAHSMALTSCGLYVWGSSKQGQLGLGAQRLCEQRPALVKALADVALIQIAAGQYHSVALSIKGQVWAWGWGVHGQLGTGSIEDEFVPVRIFKKKSQPVCQIATGYAHTMLLTTKGEVWVFGCSLFGQLGNGANKKQMVPVKVDGFAGPIRLISSGFFHSYAVTERDRIYTWGCNPQILRLEAQQKKKERIQAIQERKKQQALAEMDRDEAEERGECPDKERPLIQPLGEIKNIQTNGSLLEPKVPEKKKSEPDEMLHLVPGEFFAPNLNGRVKEIACGNQHTLFLSDRGKVYAYGKNMDGQLGINSRKEAKEPTLIDAFHDDFIVHVACGIDFSLAVSDSGSVFAWGNNGGAQLGKLPLSENPEISSKLVVMKNSTRIVRLPNNLVNSCDIPKPVNGITEGVYSNEILSIHDAKDQIESDVRTFFQNMNCFKKVFPGNLVHEDEQPSSKDVETMLHLTLETFHQHLDTKKLIKNALIYDNAPAASKLSLLKGNLLQAFDFSLQAIVKGSLSQGDTMSVMGDHIFNALLFYLKETQARFQLSADLSQDDSNTDSEIRRQLVERLVACWQDQKLSFVHLETLFLGHANALLLQTLVLTLFCPSDERQTDRGPVMNEESGPKLVDLFTPEFCLRIGDTFVKEFKESSVRSGDEETHRKASIVADNWLSSQRGLALSDLEQD